MAQTNGSGFEQLFSRDTSSLGFAAYLRELPPARVLERFVGAGQRERRILSAAELGRIATGFTDDSNLVRVFEDLAPDVKRACALAYLLLPEGVNAEETAGAGQALLESFLVHAVRDKDNNLYYRGFDEFEPALRTVLASTLSAASARTLDNRHAWPLPVHVVNDLVLTLAMAGNGSIQTTKSGALAKASQVIVRRLLHCGKTHWRRDLHRTLEIFLKFGASNGLLTEHHGVRRLHRAALARLLSHGVAHVYGALVRHAAASARPWHWALAMESFKGSSGDDSASVWHSLECMGTAAASTLSEGAQLAEALGLVCATVDGTETLVAASPDAMAVEKVASGVSTDESLTVLPDFSVIVHQECQPTVLQDFCEVGELFSLDAVYRGTVSRQAVADSLFSGVSAAQVLSRLQLWRAPSNVIETVKEWIREFERVSIPEERVVMVSDPVLFGQLCQLAEVNELVVPVTLAGVLRIRQGREAEVRRILGGMGFDTRAPRALFAGSDSDAGVTGADEFGERPEDGPELVTGEERRAVAPRRPTAGGKYGRELKSLAPTEMDHVIDYAIIMGHRLRVDYEGSPGLKRCEYEVAPESSTAGAEGVIEGEDCRTGTRKRWLRARIRAIGVLAD